MSDEEWQPVAAAAAATLDALDEVIVGVSRAIRESVPEYAYVSDEQLKAATTINVTAMLLALRDRRHLNAQELEDFSTTVQERARNGVPIDEYLLAVLTAEAEMWEQLWKRAADVPEARRSEAFALRFANVNSVTRITVSAHRRIELVTAREDQERRALALRALLRGGLDPADEREHLAQLGLSPGRPYFVVRARGRGSMTSDQLPRALAKGLDRPPHSAFVLWGEDTVGLLRDHPADVTGLTAGLAGPVSLHQLPKAHSQATSAFETAWALGLDGAYDLPGLGLRAAVQASPEVGEALREKYLSPLSSSGSLGDELLATIRAFLESGSRREATATKLHVHHNTVGYRLNRFSELTEADLSDLTTLAELHWLFVDLDLRPRG
ncbi:MAG: hypothetical protein JWO12_1574 [Frankiales bacterium]|nr:hypothetical protein [Frankiales bacterium]